MMVTFEITENIAVLSERDGWNLEANWVSWNGAEPKVDIRRWKDDHEKCSKGITLTAEEARTLKDVLEGI